MHDGIISAAREERMCRRSCDRPRRSMTSGTGRRRQDRYDGAMGPETWMRAAGLGTWLVAVVPTIIAFAHGELAATRALAFGLAALAFLAAFVVACATPSGRRGALAAHAAQSAAAIAMVWFGHGVVTAAIFVVVASQLPAVASSAVATAWILVQSAALALRFGALHSGPALVTCAAFAGFQAFALAAASLASSERRARDAAGEHSRALERLRVARELHDTLGHHLTALGMQLEVAARLADGRVKDHVEQAHAIGRLLLADVRDAVSDLRDQRPLGPALRALVAALGDLEVQLELSEELDSLCGAQADAIIRCVQEVMTNTARHAEARSLWISITADRSAISLRARNDGPQPSAADAIAWGHGLTGMSERFLALGGRVDARRTADGGFEIAASMPRVRR
jgi:signal transduction histidine kinase